MTDKVNEHNAISIHEAFADLDAITADELIDVQISIHEAFADLDLG